VEAGMNLFAAKKLAHELMHAHGLLPDWTFAFDKAIRRFGSCNERKKRITLSARLTELNSSADVRETILHEIAHALAGVRAGHGAKWRRTAAAIGCNAQRCYGEEIRQPPVKYVGRCPTCGYEIRRLRRRRISCGRCDRRFNPKYVFAWRRASSGLI
jgi:predicted SprT family Zn-dependent metalloprotease